MAKSKEVIHVEGVREHNLRNLTLDIPRGKFIAVTGVSGSGKSTLAFNVLFSEIVLAHTFYMDHFFRLGWTAWALSQESMKLRATMQR